jgi:hypothetical protein
MEPARVVFTALPIITILASAGCSLILNFDNSQVPLDAMLDAPFSEAECAYMEPNDTIATATAFATTDVGPAAICPVAGGGEDHDFYKVTLPAASTMTITITFTNRPTGDLDLRLFDAATSTMQAQSRGFGDTERITCPGQSPQCPQLAAGDYVFEVFPASAGAVNTYTPALTITTP